MPAGPEGERQRPRRLLAGARTGCAGVALGLTLAGLLLAAPIAAPHILVLEDESAERPAFVEFMRGFRREVGALGPAVVYTENLDLARFTDPAHLRRQSEWVKSKYRDVRIDILVTGGPRSLAYALRERTALFPNTSILFATDAAPVVPGVDVSGAFIGLDTKRSLREALDPVPGTRNVALVSDSVGSVPYWLTLREDLKALPQDMGLILLEGLPIASRTRSNSRSARSCSTPKPANGCCARITRRSTRRARSCATSCATAAPRAASSARSGCCSRRPTSSRGGSA